MQGILNVAAQLTGQQQTRRLARQCRRNQCLSIAHLAIENAPFGQLNAHAAVLDQDTTTAFTQGWPAGLKGQLGIMHSKEQADAARSIFCAFVQRTLVLEIAFIHRATPDGTFQPSIQVGTHARRTAWQVFLGKARIAVAQPDTQVHVIFLRRINTQADEEVTGDRPLLALHTQVRAA